jgi:hypothetical protein
VTRKRSHSRSTGLSRRDALAVAGGALGLGLAGCARAQEKPAEPKRAASVQPKLTYTFAPAKPTEGVLFKIAITADKTNPKLMGLAVYDLSRKGKKALRQMICQGTIVPGQTFTVTFRPAGTDDKKMSVRVVGWDRENPPQKGDDPRKILFRDRKGVTFA